MKTKVYVIFDSKVSAYLQPFFARTAGEALRMWESTVNDPKTQISKYPADFTLYETAEFNEATGAFTQHLNLLNLGTALEVKAQQPADINRIA